MALLNHYSAKMQNDTSHLLHVYGFCSQFIPTIQKENGGSIKLVAKLRERAKLNFTELNFILFPVHFDDYDGHWALIVRALKLFSTA